jgi:protein SCO1/2
MTSQLTRVQNTFADDNDFKILSFTVDPEHDSIDVLKSYALKYNAKASVWHFLTGEKQLIYRLAKDGFKINALEDPNGGIEFVHSDKLILVDKNRIIRGFYDGTDPKDVDRLITEIKVLQHEYNR